MRWINIKNNTIPKMECINPKTDKYIIHLSANQKNIIIYNPDYEQDVDRRVVSIFVINNPTVSDIKKILISLQQEYDSSREVNCFILDNEKGWLDKATRVGLFNVFNIEKNNNSENTTLWFNNKPIEINVDKAIKLLTAVELYSKQCYDNTQKHYKEIKQLETIEDCLNYDITAGYPDILNIQTK